MARGSSPGPGLARALLRTHPPRWPRSLDRAGRASSRSRTDAGLVPLHAAADCAMERLLCRGCFAFDRCEAPVLVDGRARLARCDWLVRWRASPAVAPLSRAVLSQPD